MLNRLFIVIGVLAIVVIAAAFIVPRFIQWGDYRGRMEEIAGEALGAPVQILGDIDFSLLPQPKLDFSEVRVGPAEAPVLTVENVLAEFSLIDFLRDRYRVTRLVLDRPGLDMRIDAAGQLVQGIVIPQQVTEASVSVASAEIIDGTISLTDARTGEMAAVGNIDGELRLDALRGPFSFQGNVEHESRAYATRISTSAVDQAGGAQLSFFLRPLDDGFSLTADGRLALDDGPSYRGTLTYSQAPPAAPEGGEVADAGRGALVVSGTVQATPARILFSNYTIVPDENRAGTRLTGAAEITLGSARAFNAVVSGGVVGLPPRDATADQSALPYEIIQLLGELSVPLPPAMSGTVGVDIAELDLRAVALRNVRLDARTDGEGWVIDGFAAQLPGNSELRLSGELSRVQGRPEFSGRVTVGTQRLHALAQLWQRQAQTNALLNLSGALDAQLSLVGETLSVSDAVLSIAGEEHPFSAEIGFAAATRHLNLRAALGEVDERQSAALFALLPNIAADPRFGVTFPKGRFDLSARRLTIDGLGGESLAARGFWDGGVLALERVAAGDLGGVRFDARLTAFGTFTQPEVSGSINLSVSEHEAPGLVRFFDVMRMPASLRDWLERSLPAELALRLDAPSGEGGQGFGVTGRAGAADVRLEAQLGQGIVRALGGPMAVRLDLRSADAAALTAQLGLGDASLTPDGAPMHLAAVVEGMASNSFESTLRVEGGGEWLAFSGNVVAGNLERLSGNGNLQASLSDVSPLMERLGAGGIWIPALRGNARIDFDGLGSIRLREIDVAAGGERIAGALQWSRSERSTAIEGSLSVGRIEPAGLLRLLAGPAAALSSDDGQWADGPVSLGDVPRVTTGRIDVAAKAIGSGDAPLATDAAFGLVWDGTTTRIRDFSAAIGAGTVRAEMSLCCAGPLPQKQVSGRMSLDDVPLGRLLPMPAAEAIGADVDAAARFEATGDSLRALLAAMTGEGSYTLDGVGIAGMDPAAFGAIESLDQVLDMEPAVVSSAIIDRLDDARFMAPSVSGGFTIAGGVLRSPNLAIENDEARLFGSVGLRLDNLQLSGGFAMSPRRPTGPDDMLTATNAAIVVNLGGTLIAPAPGYDVGGVADTIMVRAYELEVARLEQLRIEDEERRRRAAEERARIVAEEAARKAAEEEAARRAAEEAAAREAAEAEAARRAAEEEAARRAAEEAASRAPQPQVRPQLQPGFNLDFTPALPANPF